MEKKEYYVDGKLHREDGPAVEWVGEKSCFSGYKSWYKNGELHRLDGPAIEWKNKQEWWIEGKRCLKVINENFTIINGEKFLKVLFDKNSDRINR